jgi:SPP1 gp7 family putative phage head morphogenesis protein
VAGTAPPKPGSYIPPWLKPIPVNTRDVTGLLRRLLATREPRLARWLYSTTNAQGAALKYQEIRNAIRDGQLSEEVLERWRQEYVSLVAMRLEPYQRELLAAMDKASNPALVLTPTAQLMGDALRTRNWALIKNVTDEQRNAVRAVMAYQATREVPLTVNELAKVLRPMVGLTEREAKAVLRWRERLVADGYTTRSVEHSVQNYQGFLLRRRADRIARTESCWAFNAGQLAQVQNAVTAGVVLTRVRKEWASAEDEMTCPVCGDELAGQVRELDEQFSYGLDFPPAHPNCRCGVIYLAERPEDGGPVVDET